VTIRRKTTPAIRPASQPGAAHAIDFLDFGLATTAPAGRKDIEPLFNQMLDVCLSLPAEALLIECGSDVLGVKCLKHRRPSARMILAAPDAAAALGGTQLLGEMGFTPTLFTGACCDTPIERERTERLCGTAVANMARGEMHEALL
jgi:hypothetical protein